MEITVDEIRQAQAHIHLTDEYGTYYAGDFVDVHTSIHVAAAQSKISQKQRDVYRCLSQITFDIWNLGTILERIEWTRQYCLANPDFSGAWRNFVSVDISQFHVEFRSIFDYAAKALAACAKQPKSVPEGSYRKLYQWLAKSDSQEKANRTDQLGQQIASLVLSTPWFMEFRDVRDSLVHQGSYVLVFGDPQDGTLFQVFGSNNISAKVGGQVFLVNPNVADFELYAALWLARLILFLETFAEAVNNGIGSLPANHSQLHSMGLDVAHNWMDKLARKVSNSS